MQHPCGGDAALGGIEHQHAAEIAFAGELVFGPRENAANAVEIVTRGKSVAGNQRLRLHFAAHAGGGVEDFPAHQPIFPPAHAAATHCSIDSSTGL